VQLVAQPAGAQRAQHRGQLDPDVHHETGDEHPRPVQAGCVEAEAEDVVALDVQDTGDDLEQDPPDQGEQREMRSTAWATEVTGGKTNSRGMTDHSLASTTGMSTRARVTCTPWVSR